MHYYTNSIHLLLLYTSTNTPSRAPTSEGPASTALLEHCAGYYRASRTTAGQRCYRRAAEPRAFAPSTLTNLLST